MSISQLVCSNQTPAQSVQLHDAGFWDCARMGGPQFLISRPFCRSSTGTSEAHIVSGAKVCTSMLWWKRYEFVRVVPLRRFILRRAQTLPF